MSSVLPISPADLGLPPKFAHWRRYQDRAIIDSLDSSRRFVCQSMPTGSGKSLVYIAQALLAGRRVVVLTSTKALQTQLLSDFQAIGLLDIRGRNNYRCRLAEGMTCEDGMNVGCSHKSCGYLSDLAAATDSLLVVTNYSYWMLASEHGRGLGPVDILVLDEGHEAPGEVTRIMTVELHPGEVYGLLRSTFLDDGSTLDQWRQWAAPLQLRALARKDQLTQAVAQLKQGGSDPPAALLKDVARWANLTRKLGIVLNMTDAWEYEPLRGGGFRFEPLWAADYAERMLFRSVPRVVIVSATLLPKTIKLLGVPDGDFDFAEYPYVFPLASSPVYFLPTAKVTQEIDETDRQIWLERIDRIIAERLDRRGIIHTVSYARRDLILNYSAFRQHMIVHEPEEALERIDQFLHTAPPVILVSPSMGTGYDFPHDACEYQIIAKVPFPDRSSRIMQARTKQDPLYAIYIACQSLVQSAGRGMRAADDRCENLIIDNSIAWLMKRHRDLFPAWFLRLYRRIAVLPRPAPKLESKLTVRELQGITSERGT